LSASETARRLKVAGMGWAVFDEASADMLAECTLPATRRLAVASLTNAQPGWADDARPQDTGLLLFTSGSTALPKGVLLSHRALLNNARGIIAHTKLGMDDVLLHVMPLYHTNGLNNQLFAPLYAGATVALGGRFRAADMPGLMELHQPTIITGVPTMYARMLDHQFSDKALQRLRFARCGSAPITVQLHERIEAHLGRPLVVSYGLSEATCTSTMNPPARRKIGSVGTVLAGQSVWLRSADDERKLGDGQEGEVCIAGPSLMEGYVGAGDLARTPKGRLDVLRTGDLGRFDEEGYLYITGRLKDVIIRGGENLSPALIENVVAGCPGVAACCVVGAPDTDLGEVPVAFVVPRATGPAPDDAAIQQAVADRLGRVYRPARIVRVPQLPENSVGKVDRKALAAQLSQTATNPA